MPSWGERAVIPQRGPWKWRVGELPPGCLSSWVGWHPERGSCPAQSKRTSMQWPLQLDRWKQILYQLSYQGSPQFSHILLVISHSLRLVFHIHIPQSPASSPHCPISPHSSHINLVFVSWTHGKYFTSVFYLLFLTHNALSQKNYVTTSTNILSQMLPLPVEDLP